MANFDTDVHWVQLFRIACSHIGQVNSKQQIIKHWTLGGGTAMMLQIAHRESDDIDIFLDDPQCLPFLDPQRRDFQFEIAPAAYEGDGVRSFKLVFDQIGEIDFIVAAAMSDVPATQTIVEGEAVLLETVAEIVTKKVYHRAFSLRPRDIFDIAAAAEQYEDSVVRELRKYPDKVAQAIGTIEKLNPEFVNGAIGQLAIRESYMTIARTAIGRAKEVLFRAT